MLHIHYEWPTKGNFTLRQLNPNHMFVTFEEEGYVEKSLARFSNSIIGFLFKIFRWYPEFDFSQDAKIVPVWIKVPNIGMGYLSQATLFPR